MKKLRIIAALLLLIILTTVTACNPLGEGEGAVEQYVKVEKGNLRVTVSGSGNIETAEDANLSFGSGGRIAKIYIEEGDQTTKGEVLAELDTASLELARDQAEYALTQVEVALTQAELSQKTAEYDLDNILDRKDTLELALFNAQINVRSAKHHLNETRDIYTWPVIETAKKDVENAEAFLQYALDQNLPEATITYAQARLAAAEAVLDAKRNTYDTEEVAIASMQLEAAERAEAQAQKNLDEMSEDIALKELQVEAAKAAVGQAKQSVALARQSLEQAEKDLKEAAIVAPFDGIVASVTAEEGDMIPSPTMSPRQIIKLIDPTSLKLVVEVDEIDIPDVKVGQEVIITLDALSDKEFAGVVATIYPVPLEVGGVIVYEVKIELDVPEDSGVRVGMTAETDIVLASRTDVLLVPDRAIGEDSEGNPIVNVLVDDDELEERAVVVGISDGFDTEIVSGLKAGETILASFKRR
ncbi:MAG TPA: efflux RND transporter periplasmic adaptor subunit [Dehalococcoidales bacterium]|nr:efflux RND transporter periplasmic adaptor subunit [Dehalococcoidales bacterium]